MHSANGGRVLTEQRGAGAAPIIELQNVSMSFAKPSGEPLVVLSGIDMALHSGEILGLLGRSGEGKSTILRIAAGLILPTSGRVSYRGEPLQGPSEGIAVVFQTFALFPWLTVLENVMMSLDALGMPDQRAHARALSAIDAIGLSGFDAAYPRELSGGMRQRVGFARALVIDPAAALMDEPFSALDVLTAESLRTDFIDLWRSQQCPIQSVLLVTHNIEEAVLLCDRILIIAGKPGSIGAEIRVELNHPRNRLDPRFREIVDRIYSILTARTVASLENLKNLGAAAMRLPAVSVYAMEGLLERLASPPLDGAAKLADIAHPLLPHVDNVIAVAEGLHILEFAELTEEELRITTAGSVYVKSEPPERKRLFKEHLVNFVPLAAHIAQVLNEREQHVAPSVRFESELEDHLSADDAEATLRTVIDWGRYAELFTYDDKTGSFMLPPGQD
jgi:NitT/TauT family transport system ATP-binding protein